MLEQNILVITIGDKTVLFDTGMGGVTAFGPTTGQLMKTLKAADIDPAAVDGVILSHAHIDHCGGIMTEKGEKNFPNAQIYIAQSDYDYWTNEATVGPKLKSFYDQAHKNLTPNRDRIHFVKDHERELKAAGVASLLGSALAGSAIVARHLHSRSKLNQPK